jgi:hypothetical protein
MYILHRDINRQRMYILCILNQPPRPLGPNENVNEATATFAPNVNLTDRKNAVLFPESFRGWLLRSTHAII